MKKQADFRQGKIRREKWIQTQQYNVSPEFQTEKWNLISRLCSPERIENEAARNHAKRKRVEEEYYPLLCKLAEENCGFIELDLDEETYMACLTVRVDSFVVDGDFFPTIGQFGKLIADADTFSLAPHEESIVMQLTFDLIDNEKMTPLNTFFLQAKEK